MIRAAALSAVVHVTVLAGATAWRMMTATPPPLAVYSVQLVGAPSSVAAPASSTPARSGVKTTSAPSTDRTAPKGGKKPGTSVSKAASPATAPTTSGMAAGMRLDGEPFPFPEYLQELMEKIQSQWERPLGSPVAGARATVFFRVARDGAVSGCHVETPSGQLDFDRSAQAAVVAATLPPLPAGFSGSQLGVHLDFTE